MDTLDRAWAVASMLPRSELSMMSPEMVERYYRDGPADPSG